MSVSSIYSNPEYIEYRNEIETDRMARSLRAGSCVVAALSTAFIPLDFIAFRSDFEAMLGFRLFCNGVMLVIILWGARTYPMRSAVVGCLTTGAMLLMVIHAAGGVGSEYMPGLMLLFLGMPVLLPFTAYQAGFIVSILTLGLGALPHLSSSNLGLDGYSLSLIFPIAAGIESVAASALLDKLRFADFLRRKEVEKARDELSLLDVEKSRFTSNIHHELRTPLTLMLAPVDALLAGTFGTIGDLPRSYLDSVRANGQRLLKLINNLLDLAKIESNRFDIRRQALDIEHLIEGYVSSARPLADEKGVTISVDWDSRVKRINADPDAMEKVVANLLSNALKFTDEGGDVSIRCSMLSGGGIHLEIRDTGIGIPKDKLESVFDRFAQVDSSATRRFEGTGIGLSLVRELVELHGGRVWAESPGQGLGSCFIVEIPDGSVDVGVSSSQDWSSDNYRGVESLESGSTITPSRSEDSSSDRNLSLQEIARSVQRYKLPEALDASDGAAVLTEAILPEDAPRVLIVDDNHEMRRLLSFLLGREFRIFLASNGTEALRKIETVNPDLVLTDVMMPEMSGTELCVELRSNPKTQLIPIVLLTSKADRDMKVEGLEVGANDYVTKPFHPEELMARIRALVRVRRLQAELGIKNARLQSTNAELENALRDLREAGSALVQAERLSAVGELAAGVAHEVNNPVNFATNALRTLKEYVSDIELVAEKINEISSQGASIDLSYAIRDLEVVKEKISFESTVGALGELVEIAVEGLDRTQRLVGDLRSFAVPSGGDLGPVDVVKGLESTLQLVQYSVREHGITIHTDIEQSLPPVLGDSGAINQVFLNLIKNAIDSVSGSMGNVWVSAMSEDGNTVIAIRDDGPGIDPSVMESLYEPFVTTKSAGKGTGLGLSICKRVVDDHFGQIFVNQSCDVGAEFVVSFPGIQEDSY